MDCTGFVGKLKRFLGTIKGSGVVQGSDEESDQGL
jgi:hypothetical protein